MPESQPFYVVDGHQRRLQRVDTARVVMPARDHVATHLAARLSRSSRLGLDASRSNGQLVVRGDADKLEEIASYPSVGSARSVFLDSEGFELMLTDDVLVRFSDASSDEDREALCGKLACHSVRKTGNLWKVRFSGSDPDGPLNAANRLAEEAIVGFAEPNALQRARFHGRPGDDLLGNQWHLNNTGQGGGVPGADVRAFEAWEISKGDPSVRVVVHDSGVDIDHPDLAPRMLPGWDFDNDDFDASNNAGPHGTACAGVIAAAGNGVGVVGVAPDCRLVPLRAAGSHTFEVWAETFRWAARRGEIISCSWSISPSNAIIDAIREVTQDGRDGLGTVVVCATGNDAPLVPGIAFPARLPEVIAVGASTNQDRRAAYSQWGPGLDVVAPSSGGTLRIETTDVVGNAGYNRSHAGDYCKASDSSGFGGTSSATPLAAGVAALMLSVNRTLTATEVREILVGTADKIGGEDAGYDDQGYSAEYGNGRVNALEAVSGALQARQAYEAAESRPSENGVRTRREPIAEATS